jgi:hypothetical protein
MATARLLGRSIASTGAVEEITLGTNLSFSGGTLNAAGGGGSSNTRLIGAGELIPRVTAGAGIDAEETSTNKNNLDYLAFDAGTAEFAQATFSWPDGFTTFTTKFHWTAASGSGAVVWSAAARCFADDAALDQAMGTAQSVTDTLLAAGDAHLSGATSATTPAGTVTVAMKMRIRPLFRFALTRVAGALPNEGPLTTACSAENTFGMKCSCELRWCRCPPAYAQAISTTPSSSRRVAPMDMSAKTCQALFLSGRRSTAVLISWPTPNATQLLAQASAAPP